NAGGPANASEIFPADAWISFVAETDSFIESLRVLNASEGFTRRQRRCPTEVGHAIGRRLMQPEQCKIGAGLLIDAIQKGRAGGSVRNRAFIRWSRVAGACLEEPEDLERVGDGLIANAMIGGEKIIDGRAGHRIVEQAAGANVLGTGIHEVDFSDSF